MQTTRGSLAPAPTIFVARYSVKNFFLAHFDLLQTVAILAVGASVHIRLFAVREYGNVIHEASAAAVPFARPRCTHSLAARASRAVRPVVQLPRGRVHGHARLLRL